MNLKIALSLALVISGCSPSEPGEESDLDRAAVSPPAAAREVLSLSDTDLIRACRGGATFRNGTPLGIIKAKKNGDNLVRLTYTRDDGKFFAYDCKTEGNAVRYRMIDEAGPGTGPGTWSGHGSRTTFEIFPNGIEFTDELNDGSTDRKRLKI